MIQLWISLAFVSLSLSGSGTGAGAGTGSAGPGGVTASGVRQFFSDLTHWLKRYNS